MTDKELVAALRALGVTPENPRPLLLLPLVQVAWADGRVQLAERLRISELAKGWGLDGNDVLLARWLRERPSEADLALGRRVLVALALRHDGPGADWGAGVLERVEQQCVDVARAAGGLFGVVFSTSAEERAALGEISAGLRHQRADIEDDLPDPDGGGFVDL